MKRILIIGATSSIAEHCARLWVREPTEFILTGRDPARLERVRLDLEARNTQTRVVCQTVNFVDPKEVGEFVANAFSSGPIDIALIAHGNLPDQADCQDDLPLVHETLEVNAISPVLFAEAVVARMFEQGRGRLAIIGSVAGDRGRRSNYVYGAAKSLVGRYAQGLQHRFANGPVKIILIKPGPTDTPMTAGMRRPGLKFADPARVAADIVRGIDMGVAVVYTPGIWRFIMLIIRHIPARVFARMNV